MIKGIFVRADPAAPKAVLVAQGDFPEPVTVRAGETLCVRYTMGREANGNAFLRIEHAGAVVDPLEEEFYNAKLGEPHRSL